ncbi:hypothetical protein IWX46DRAFT_15610 [Phyllosticta citricarpa]|uniref:Uncharacterized protein n=1 Tax=Phyllosticta citricarpa TaxID=55181 RepID=A0ABR1MTU7_9PEZI
MSSSPSTLPLSASTVAGTSHAQRASGELLCGVELAQLRASSECKSVGQSVSRSVSQSVGQSVMGQQRTQRNVRTAHTTHPPTHSLTPRLSTPVHACSYLSISALVYPVVSNSSRHDGWIRRHSRLSVRPSARPAPACSVRLVWSSLAPAR